VGAVDGRLTYDDGSRDPLAQGQGHYWRYEHLVRNLESELGLLAVVAGACFAVRRSLLRPMDASIGEDCIVPLDVVSQGKLVVHEPAAVAWDRFDEGNAFAFRRRIRMTLRNWQGTWTRPRLLNPFLHPGYALALWSHKLLRWLSPVFVLVALISSALLVATQGSILAWLALAPLLTLFALGLCGWWTQRFGVRIPGAGTAFSFLLANLAFLVGVIKAVSGNRVQRYQKA
jgi:cellulose synthase/poly-beta-1,6-N-acetylglucosamine synthase-like glycosyltransferase